MTDQTATQTMIQVQLKWPTDDNLQAQYANQFGIAGFGNEFVLMFGEYLPTWVLSGRSEEETKTLLQNALVKPIAKVVVTKDGLKAFASLLNDIVAKQLPTKPEG